MASWIDRIPRWLRNALRPARPFYRATQLWSEADGGRMSAAMSFYGVLSLAPLLLLLVAVLGWWVDRKLLEPGLITQIGTIVGEQGSALIEQALASAKGPRQGCAASLIGFAVLLSGATGVFGELQAAFERLWVSRRRAAGRGRNGGMGLRCACAASPTCWPSASCCWCRSSSPPCSAWPRAGRASSSRWNRRSGCSMKSSPSLSARRCSSALMRMSGGPRAALAQPGSSAP